MFFIISHQNFKHRIVGFEERSHIVASNNSYIYSDYERRRSFDRAINNGRTKNKARPNYTIEIVNGTRLLRVNNRTYVIGKAANVAQYKNVSKSEESKQERSKGYSIMLNSCFIHRAYLEIYFDSLMAPPGIIDYVEERKNCEDILMSVTVTKFLNDIGWKQCGALAVKAMDIRNLEDEARKGIYYC